MLIKSEILITMGMGWPVSSDKWKAPLDGTIKKATEIMHCDVFGGINMTMSSFRFLTLSFTIIF